MSKQKQKIHWFSYRMKQLEKGWHSMTVDHKAMFKYQLMLVVLGLACVLFVAFYGMNRSLNLTNMVKMQRLQQAIMYAEISNSQME